MPCGPLMRRSATAPVFRRREFLADQAIADIGRTGEKHCHQHDDKGRRKAGMKRLAIEIRQAAANAAREERAMPFAFHRGACFLQEARGEHGAKCERDHGGKKNRNCQHEAEFVEQAARLPRQEGNRHENGSKRKRGGG